MMDVFPTPLSPKKDTLHIDILEWVNVKKLYKLLFNLIVPGFWEKWLNIKQFFD